MENNKMLVLGGGAIACVALGYLGIKFMGEENEDIENEKKEENKVDLKEEIKEEIKNIKKNVESGWGQFWKGAYEETIIETKNDKQTSESN
jgi:hypothetical protein